MQQESPRGVHVREGWNSVQERLLMAPDELQLVGNIVRTAQWRPKDFDAPGMGFRLQPTTPHSCPFKHQTSSSFQKSRTLLVSRLLGSKFSSSRRGLGFGHASTARFPTRCVPFQPAPDDTPRICHPGKHRGLRLVANCSELPTMRRVVPLRRARTSSRRPAPLLLLGPLHGQCPCRLPTNTVTDFRRKASRREELDYRLQLCTNQTDVLHDAHHDFLKLNMQNSNPNSHNHILVNFSWMYVYLVEAF